MPPDDLILSARLEAVNDAQKRTRLAIFLSTLAAGVILAGLWNLYFSFDSHWATPSQPATWGEQQVASEEIKSWVNSNTVGISILGIRLSTSDAAITGGFFLLILTLYHYLCARRENHEIGAVLVEAQNVPVATRLFVFTRIRAFMLVPPEDENDAPYEQLSGRTETRTDDAGLRIVIKFLTYLPATAILAIVLSDIYNLFWYVPPYTVDTTPQWRTSHALWEFAVVDGVAVSIGWVVWRYCRRIAAFKNGTLRLMSEFRPAATLPAVDEPAQTL